MIRVHLESRAVFPWTRIGAMRFRGVPPVDPAVDSLAPGEASTGAEIARWEQRLERAAIPFGAVVQSEGFVLATVDACRSFPLFYARRGDDVLLSDDARWVLSEMGFERIDEIAAGEALAAGFVSDTRTLFPSVKQLPAGDTLRVVQRREGLAVDVRPARRFDALAADADDDPPARAAVSRLSGPWSELDALLRDVARRLFDAIDGRCVVIPLSGGFDSRLVAMLAKQAGYDRVFCLGPQRVTSREASISREVASRLGFEWAHFGGEPAQWRESFASAARRTYYREADGLCVLPPLLEWPALRELARSGRVPSDAIVVPGHYGDFVTGSATPETGARRERNVVDAAMELLTRRRYRLNPWPAPLASAMRERLRATIEQAATGGVRNVDEVVDRWEWREATAKGTGPSVRAYEQCGFEWRLPLADPEVVRFWRSVTHGDRLGNRLHHCYVNELGRRWRLPAANPGVDEARRLRRWANRLGLLAPARPLRRLARRLDGRGIARGDEVGWSALFDPREVRRTYTGLEGVESYLARDWLSGLAEATGPEDLL